jgi:aryl-alcohol dehydrogenase-like predicted oxidoreductase
MRYTLLGRSGLRVSELALSTMTFPHDFLASADYIFGGMSARLDLPPGRSRYG